MGAVSRRGVALLALLAPPSALARGAKPSCAMCMLLQEAVQRSLRLNVSRLASGQAGGEAAGLELPVRDVVKELCDSEAWRAQRYHERFDKACRKLIGDPDKDIAQKKVPKDTFRFTLYHWRNPAFSSEATELQRIYGRDPTFALRMKRQVCGHSGGLTLNACEEEELPPAAWDEGACVVRHACEMCRAIVASAFGVVQQSRERPRVGGGTDYERLADRLALVCEEMPMRYPVKDVAEALERCQDMWEEHASAFLHLAVDRSEGYAVGLCSQRIGSCPAEMTLKQLYRLVPRKSNSTNAAAEADSSERADPAPPMPPSTGKQEL